MKNKKTFPLILSLLLLSGVVMGAITFLGLEPDDNWKTSDKTPRFCVRPNSSVSETINLTLFIGEDRFGEKLKVGNNTRVCLSTNASLGFGSYLWKFGGNDTATQTNSTARTITVSMFGSAVQVLGDIPEIFVAIVQIIIGVIPLLIGIAIIGFILALLAEIIKGINKKIKE